MNKLQGSVKVADRTSFWKTKRVFYCTPQTFHNDLKAQRADASRVVLVVLDEGKYTSLSCLAVMACLPQ
jgi:ERCC4-related helicase